jgi:hypothetical protein
MRSPVCVNLLNPACVARSLCLLYVMQTDLPRTYLRRPAV